MKTPFGQKQPLSQKEVYDKLYKNSKVGGEPFVPHTVAKDAAVALLVVALIIALALLFPATSEAPADPTSTSYVPRPEWYFLFFFQFLKMFPGSLEPVSAVLIPMAFILLLLLVPFLSRGIDRRWSKRKLSVSLGIFVALGVIALEVVGAVTSSGPSTAPESPLVLSGQRVYVERQCSYCHSINGIGGVVGPDLSAIGGTRTPQALTAYLQNPSSVTMHTLHPKLLFSTDELNALVAYLGTLGAQVPYTAEAPALVSQHCLVCHTINGQGGSVGPNLSAVGSNRSLNFLENLISNPASEVSGATMPAFKNVLTPAQINDVAAYLYSLRGTQSTPTPTITPTSTPTVTPTASAPPTSTLTSGAVSYSSTIQPILNASCTGCHGTTAGVTLSSYSTTIASNVIVAYSPTGSLLYKAVTGSGVSKMPPGGSLTTAQIQSIADWINQGAPNN